MTKIKRKLLEKGAYEDNEDLKNDLHIINEKFSYSIIIKLKDMLVVAQDYHMFSLQLRIISLMVEHNDISHSRPELL